MDLTITNIYRMSNHDYGIMLRNETMANVGIEQIAFDLEMSVEDLKKLIKKNDGVIVENNYVQFSDLKNVKALIEDLAPRVVMQTLLGR